MTVSEHRGVQLKTGSVLLILLLFTAQFLPAQEKKKKGNFWKILDQVITVDGQPVGSSGLFDKEKRSKTVGVHWEPVPPTMSLRITKGRPATIFILLK